MTPPVFPPFRLVLVHSDEDEHLGRAQAPPGFLSPAEEAILSRLTVPVRRKKWLLGRFAGKRLLREALAERRGQPPPASALSILNEPSGAPYAVLDTSGERLPWALSLSHRGDRGLAALVVDAPGVGLGADLETVEPRDPALVGDFFTEAEAAAVAALGGREAVLAVARTWSAKEAVMKALGTGLRLDTRAIEITDAPPDAGSPPGWLPLGVRWPREALASQVSVVWRDGGDHVLTVALTR